MFKKKFSSEQIIRMLRQVEVLVSQGISISQASKELKISDATYYKWRKEYGGMQVSQAKRLKNLELENTRLKRAIADLTLSNQMLKDVAQGN